MIQQVLSTLLDVIVPLAIPVTAGALLARYKNLDTKPLLTLYLYFLTPAIILDTLANAEISFGDVYQTIAFALLNLLLLWLVSVVLGRLLKLAPPEAAGLTLISTFTNSVNYGLPLVLLAFGQLGLDKASVYVIVQMVIVNTIGVYFAARSQFNVKSAVKSVFALPAVYAALLALLLRGLSLQLPQELASGVSMVAGAYSPVVLAILGAQMVRVQAGHTERNVQLAFWTGLSVRLLLSPLIALLVLLLLNISGTLFSVLLVLASMPVAVNSVVLAERFGSSPSLVSRCIVWTTLASFLVLPVLITAVGSVQP
ncbi:MULTISPECIES: AEC family transporter [unclassified Paenibacillus]|uniref:AEC family transporter n=1 Tax=unclassified Paenibacillus TaxID=185978 RepID=UPI0024072A5B|nr:MULTISPECIES: AEC family transporter [unclassified Paenibacillus]MDF9839899.1 putative permease [Paenibacillus sp. PastF-2]MDF9846481.1 putative permease [Paenibacillus sp. PastM-2]MDF9853171.1 putative permease [Paenibacillus sp. PastF-1]MDH6478325.1 putative permease [Paenibacillus sp. PastH-2]MDH6506177.1 putative permease [Paenibacillus sp. PastM-3]